MRLSELRKQSGTGCSYASPTGAILEAAIAVADADSEDDAAWHRAWMRLRMTLLRQVDAAAEGRDVEPVTLCTGPLRRRGGPLSFTSS